MKLRTEIEHTSLRQLIDCPEGVLMLGSCFTDHIGEWLEASWLPVLSNPFGVLFNPGSIARTLCRVEKEHSGFPLHERAGLYFSFEHHGRFSGKDPEKLQGELLVLDEKVATFLGKARHLFITFGTAWVYERQGQIVANCHKFPASDFVRRRMSVSEIVDLWGEVIEQCSHHCIFTVSPIRHVRDTLHGNELSKATLLLAIEELQRSYPERVEYLPIYELLIDDLRDYRFYADDLVHPSAMAVELVREFVTETCFMPRMREYVEAAALIIRALSHKPNDPDSEEYQQFLHDTLLRKDALMAKYHIPTSIFD